MNAVARTLFIALVAALTVAGATPALAQQATPAGKATPEEAAAELAAIEDLYRIVTSYHVMLRGDGVTSDQVNAVVFDVVRYVDEIDARFELARLFIDDPAIMEQIRQVVAKAHLQAALLHARGIDIEGSIDQYEEAISLLGQNLTDWTEDVERRAHPGLLPGAHEIVFEMAPPSQIVEDLKEFWAAGVVTRFQVEGFSRDQRMGLQLVRIGGATDAFSEAFFALAEERFRQRCQEGHEAFRVVLPPGSYKAFSDDPGVESRQFRLVAGGIPDPIILNPNTFSFNLTVEDESPCLPKLYLNGVEQTTLVELPYGTYRVEPPPDCPRRLPDKITVEQRGEVTLRTEPERLDMVREGQPIFLFITTPPGSTYTLRF